MIYLQRKRYPQLAINQTFLTVVRFCIIIEKLGHSARKV